MSASLQNPRQFITQLLFFIIVRSDGVCMYSRRVTGSICQYIMIQIWGELNALTIQLIVIFSYTAVRS